MKCSPLGLIYLVTHTQTGTKITRSKTNNTYNPVKFYFVEYT